MAFFSAPFRPFFFLTALSAVLIPMYFVCIVINEYPFPGELINSFAWHGHEMVFGFTSALLTGFLLTASAKWTGRPTFKNGELALLVLSWVVARVVIFFQPNMLLVLFIVPIPLCLLLIKMFIILKGSRNFIPITLILSVLLSSELMLLYGASVNNSELVTKSYKIAAMAIYILLFIFSGRLITFFTNSRFKKELVSLNSRAEIITFTTILSSFLLYIFDYEKAELYFCIIALLLMIYRGIKLFSKEVFKEKMLIILVVAHSWLVLFFGVRIINILNPDISDGQSSFHALFAGALATFAIGIMARASLGHSGRKIESSFFINCSFISLTLGALVRVLTPLFTGNVFNWLLHFSMGFWTLGFIFFLIKFTPIYLKKRAS